MTPSQVNPTPKARFQTEQNIKEHHALLETPAFDRAEDLALLEYARKLSLELGNSQNPQVQGMVNGWKMTGVHEFLSEFRNLGEKPVVVEPPGIARRLDHKN